MSRDSVARLWLAAAMAGPVQRTGKASVKLQERAVVPSWVVSSTVISLSSACLAGLPEPLLHRLVVGHAGGELEIRVAHAAGEVVGELVVAALGPLEDVELHREAVAFMERADREAGDAEPEVVIGEDAAGCGWGHG